jgi:hypothetical protein
MENIFIILEEDLNYNITFKIKKNKIKKYDYKIKNNGFRYR